MTELNFCPPGTAESPQLEAVGSLIHTSNFASPWQIGFDQFWGWPAWLQWSGCGSRLAESPAGCCGVKASREALAWTSAPDAEIIHACESRLIEEEGLGPSWIILCPGSPLGRLGQWKEWGQKQLYSLHAFHMQGWSSAYRTTSFSSQNNPYEFGTILPL